MPTRRFRRKCNILSNLHLVVTVPFHAQQIFATIEPNRLYPSFVHLCNYLLKISFVLYHHHHFDCADGNSCAVAQSYDWWWTMLQTYENKISLCPEHTKVAHVAAPSDNRMRAFYLLTLQDRTSRSPRHVEIRLLHDAASYTRDMKSAFSLR